MPNTETPLDPNDPDDPRNSSNFRDVRKWGEDNEARAKAAEEKATAAETRIAELEKTNRERDVAEAAKAKGLTDEQFAALKQLNPDPTVEAIEAFAAAFVTDRLPDTGDENQPEDLLPGTAPTPASAAPPRPASGDSTIKGKKSFSTADFAAAARSGDEVLLRQMAAEVARDPSRLDLQHGDLIPD